MDVKSTTDGEIGEPLNLSKEARHRLDWLGDQYVSAYYPDHKVWSFSPENEDDRRTFAELRANGIIETFGAEGNQWNLTDSGQQLVVDGQKMKTSTSPFAELAELARRLAVQASQMETGQFPAWSSLLRGLLAKITPDGRPATDVSTALDAGSLGAVIDAANYLSQKSLHSFPAHEKARAVKHLNAIATALEHSKMSGASEQAVPHLTKQHDSLKMFRDWIVSEGKLGKGGQGEVVPVWHPSRHLKGALKRPTGHRARTEQGQNRFAREINALRTIQSPFIAEVLDAGTDPEPFLVTELACFGSLDDCRDAYRGDLWRCLRLARDVAVGLGKAHSKDIVHRDIKPGNILLCSLEHPLIADFGIAHFDDKTPLTETNERVGSFFFAPHEWETRNDPTPAFDVFGLGAVLYWAIMGDDERACPYRSRKVLSPVSDLVGDRKGRPIDALIRRMLEHESTGRIQTMGEVIEALDVVIEELFGGRSRDPGVCLACSTGRYVSVGPFRFAGGTEIDVLPPGARDEVGFTELGPELLVCNGCGDARVVAHKMRLK